MPGLIALVTAISNDVMAKMAAAGMPSLVDAQIVFGRDKEDETSAPPRIVFLPRASRFEPRSTPAWTAPINPQHAQSPGSGIASFAMTAEGSGYSLTPTVTLGAPDVVGGVQATAVAVVRSNGAIAKLIPTLAGSGYLRAPTVTITDSTGVNATATVNLQPPPQTLAVIQQRSILTEVVQFDVLCWGVATSGTNLVPDPIGDYDATQKLYQQVIASTHLLAAGCYKVGNGKWVDTLPGAMSRDVLGRMYLFGLEISTPVLDTPIPASAGLPVQFAPVNTQANPTNFIVPFEGGSPEQGSSG